MKKLTSNTIILIAFIAFLLLVSCQTSDENVNDNRQLNRELLQEQQVLKNQIEKGKLIVSDLKEQASVLNKIMSIDSPRYVLTLELKQSHVSLNIGKHIKDDMNKIEFQMPVDQIFYNKVEVGDNLVDEFRSGSFFTEGSFGSWKIKVKKKEIK